MNRNRMSSGLIVLGAMALVLASCGKAPKDAPKDAPADAASASMAPVAIGPIGTPGIALTDAVIQLPLVSGNPGVAYFKVSQVSGAARKLVGVTVDGAARAEMHESRTAGGVSSMDEVKSVAIEPGKGVEFKPGSYHVMLFEVEKALKPGMTRELTATFDNGDKTTVLAKVQSGTGDGAPIDHMDHM
ncbi:copper chaperone PCu(A)C [Novosphingobium sp.]|uniref:copper chaperone PCu(A)C n=1 Tax=Novosphingobium sp. TaxID=1874826 RepID=UPI0025D1B1CF|nr:copper chaperone PCu(A)C [Novosphingobium sp.]